MLKEKLRFLVIGTWNTLFGYGLFVVLYLLLQGRLHYVVIMVLGHVLAVTNAFLCYRHLVFRSKGRFLGEYLRFNFSYLGSLILGVTGMYLLVEECSMNPLGAQAVLLALTVVLTFIVHKYYTFRRLSGRVTAK
jgi:putative flippase GtrA